MEKALGQKFNIRPRLVEGGRELGGSETEVKMGPSPVLVDFSSLGRKRVLGVGSVAHKLPLPPCRQADTVALSRLPTLQSHVNKGWIHLHTFSSRIRRDKTNRDGVVVVLLLSFSPALLLFFTTVRVARAGGCLPNDDGHERTTNNNRKREDEGVEE